jgi:hypothetical protein
VYGQQNNFKEKGTLFNKALQGNHEQAHPKGPERLKALHHISRTCCSATAAAQFTLQMLMYTSRRSHHSHTVGSAGPDERTAVAELVVKANLNLWRLLGRTPYRRRSG